MTKTLRAFGFALAVLGLYACNQEDRTATGVPDAAGTGSAVVRLPAVPQEYLAKTGPVAKVWFALTITGEGMDPIRKTWPLSVSQPESVTVNGIPAGYKRLFTGQLYKSDSTGRDSSLTHEGRDSVPVERGKTAEVHLFLLKKGNGSAHVCVDVEGWAADTTCIRPPGPVQTQVSGCWKLAVTKKGIAPKADTVFTGKLSITQWDSSLFASIVWNSGARDTSIGAVLYKGVVRFGPPVLPGAFFLKASLDSLNTTLQGEFNDSARHIAGSMKASRTVCDTVVVPPVVDTIKACFNVAQTLKIGKSGSGRLVLRSVGQNVRGAFMWTGFTRMSVSGDVTGSIGDTAIVRLIGVAPKGMIDVTGKKLDTLSYKAAINKNAVDGDLSILLPPGLQANGIWKGTRSACTDKDSIP